MILLVWNTLALCDIPAAPLSDGAFTSTGELPAAPVGTREDAAVDSEASPRSGPLSARQKYLLGKRIDINNALKDEINALPGISDAMADAIVAERERVGGFRSPEDLLKVKGIKEKRLKKILPFLMKMENN
jgi:competence ComEA-like helix-hairpin-helix protein